jgi:D-sedoheptulose 7-phosphate isomerase
MTFAEQYAAEAAEILKRLDLNAIEQMAEMLATLRARGGRLFIIGVGGGAGHASHAVNDFRKITDIEAYSPVDNVAELTARTNDEGWDTSFAGWLRVSRLKRDDALLVFSVGGGSVEHGISSNIVRAVEHAKAVGATVLGVVGRDGGYTARQADVCVIVPTVNAAHVTPHTESFQALVWHLLVAHPRLQRAANKWERTAAPGEQP